MREVSYLLTFNTPRLRLYSALTWGVHLLLVGLARRHITSWRFHAQIMCLLDHVLPAAEAEAVGCQPSCQLSRTTPSNSGA